MIRVQAANRFFHLKFFGLFLGLATWTGLGIVQPVRAQFKSSEKEMGSIWEDWLGDGSYQQVSVGYWYAFWTPAFTWSNEDISDIDVDPTLLKETTIRLQAQKLGGTGLLFKYFANDFFDGFNTEAEKRFDSTTRDTAKEIFTQLRQRVSFLAVFGSATVGKFESRAQTSPNAQTILGASGNSSTTYYNNNAVESWFSEYQQYDAALVIDLISLDDDDYDGRYGFAGPAVGIRFVNMTRPLAFNIEEQTTDVLNQVDTEILVLSDYQATYVTVGMRADVQAGPYGFGGQILYAYGNGEWSNDYFSPIDSNSAFFEISMHGTYPIYWGRYGSVGIYAGYRFNLMITQAGSVTALDNQEVTVRANDPALADRGLPQGFKGTVYSSQLDIFHGPYFGVRMQF